MLGVPTNKTSFCSSETPRCNVIRSKSKRRSKFGSWILKIKYTGGMTISSPSGKPCFRASRTPKRVSFATGHHWSRQPLELGNPWCNLRSGIHSVTASLGREHHTDTASASVGREHCTDTATAQIGKEQRRSGFTLKFSGDQKILLYGHLKARYTHSIVHPKATNIPVKRKPIIVINFASVRRVPINLELPAQKYLTTFNMNQTCLDTHNDTNEKLISKLYLPTNLSSVFNPPVYTSDDEDFIPVI